MVAEMIRHKFNRQDYYHLLETGILQPSDRVELIKGEIIQMSPISSLHAAHVKRLNYLFAQKFGSQVLIAVQNPVMLDDYSEPQPDLALLLPRADFYAAGHPQVEDIFLLVEVSNTTLEVDRQIKIPLYAASGIQEVWLVNTRDRSLEVYRRPLANTYQEIQVLTSEAKVKLLALPLVELAVAEILGDFLS
jgi:Uma2 family endonuclease